jgi:hypothetical protein
MNSFTVKPVLTEAWKKPRTLNKSNLNVMFCRLLFVCPFPVVVLLQFWLPLWYLQTLFGIKVEIQEIFVN